VRGGCPGGRADDAALGGDDGGSSGVNATQSGDNATERGVIATGGGVTTGWSGNPVLRPRKSGAACGSSAGGHGENGPKSRKHSLPVSTDGTGDLHNGGRLHEIQPSTAL
jgi:hypothetical protein